MVGRRYVSLAWWAQNRRKRLEDAGEALNEQETEVAAETEAPVIELPLPEHREAA